MIGSAIYDRLSTDSGVSAIVGTRVFPGYARLEEGYPQIIFLVTDLDELLTYGGVAGLTNVTVHVICVDTSYKNCDALAEAVRVCLQQQGGQWGGIIVNNSTLDSVIEDTDSLGPENQQTIYHTKTMTFDLWYGTIPQGSTSPAVVTSLSYVKTFNATSDWGSAVNGEYYLTVHHNLNTKDLVVEVWDDTTAQQVFPTWNQIDANSIQMQITATPDNRFAGRAVIVGTS